MTIVERNSGQRIIEFTAKQTTTILEIIANLHWDLVRESLDFWSDQYPEMDENKIKRAQKLVDDLQEIESIIRGVPIL